MAGNPMMAQMMQPENMERILSDPMAQELLRNPAAMQQAMQALQGSGGLAGMGAGGMGAAGGMPASSMGGAQGMGSIPGNPAAAPPGGGGGGAAPEAGMTDEEMLERAIQESLHMHQAHETPPQDKP